MEDRFVAQAGAAAWQLSNPPILSMAALKASLDLFHQVGMPALRKKSIALTGLLYRLLSGEDEPLEVITPEDPEQRGSHLSMRINGRARDLVAELGRQGFVCDAREPDILRAAPVPLYNRFTDVVAFARALRDAVRTAT